ncbi:18684_t:CDS:2 [Funneliformis geosporum]|nr:18684_t:CDS:2 [Funneliformis geosporum]
MSELVKLMSDWNQLREKGVTKNNFEELINGAQKVVEHLKKIEEEKVKCEKLAFDIEVVCKRMSRLNDELLMVRIDSEKSKSFLYIIFESSGNEEIAKQQMDLFYHLHKKFKNYTNENGYCDIVSFLSYLEEEIKPYFFPPFTYALIPEGDRKVTEELIRKSLGRELDSKKLKETYFSKEIKKADSFPFFRLRIKEKKTNEETVEKGYFYTDLNYYKEIKERELKKFLNEKERNEISIDKSIHNSKIVDGSLDSLQKRKKAKKKSDGKLKTLEKNMNRVTEEKLQSTIDGFTEEEIKALKKLLENSNQITVPNKSPFNSFKVGDSVTIDIAEVTGLPRSTVFGESQIKRNSFYESGN